MAYVRRSWRRSEAPHPKTAEPRAEACIVDAIAVVQQIAWRGVAYGLHHALRYPRARRVRGDTDVDDPAALEGGDDERVEGPEVDGDHREEVAGPNLRGMAPEKGAPGLTAATLQVLWAVLRDGPRRDPPAERPELAGDPVLPPEVVFTPHPSDEVSQLSVDGRPADPTARTPASPQPPRRPMPPENRRGSHDDHGLEQSPRSGRQRRDQPSVQPAKPGTRCGPTQHGELLAEQEVLGGDGGARRQESRGGGDYVAKEVDHGGILGNLASRVQLRRAPASSKVARRLSAAHRGLRRGP
jgi:hypothetical protein